MRIKKEPPNRAATRRQRSQETKHEKETTTLAGVVGEKALCGAGTILFEKNEIVDEEANP